MKLKARKRLTRKEMKQDKFITATLWIVGFLRRNFRQVVTTALVVVLAVIIGVSVSHSRRERNEKAASLLGKAELDYHSRNYQAAIRQYQLLIQDYGGTESGKLARFYLGNCYFFIGQFDQAIEVYRQFLRVYNKNRMLQASALAGIAACYEQMGKYREAADQYRESARKYPATFLAPQYLYDAGRCYQAAGAVVEARTAYQTLINSYPESLYARMAQMALGSSQ